MVSSFKRCILVMAMISLSFALVGCGKNTLTTTSPTTTTTAPKVESNIKVEDHDAVFNTNMGTFTVRLYGTKAPVTVHNFDTLVASGFYTNTIFHRVIEGFMIQGGDPQGNGTGGPGYEIPDEFSKDLHFDKYGILAMANRGPNTGGSQFFITLGPTPWLDNKHTIFGMVIKGFDVVEKISKVKTNKNDKPLEPIIIESIQLQDIDNERAK